MMSTSTYIVAVIVLTETTVASMLRLLIMLPVVKKMMVSKMFAGILVT